MFPLIRLVWLHVLNTQDLQLALEAAGKTKSPVPMGAMATQLYQLLCEQGHEDKDFSYIFKFLEKMKS